MKTRREFLATTGASLVGAALATGEMTSAEGDRAPKLIAAVPAQEPAGMPPAFGTAKPAGPEVSTQTFVEA